MKLRPPLLLFCAFAVFVFLSNAIDWDQFYSYADVDLRSWFIDHRPPLWSYQLCAGAPRLGDPQSFGLSPVFAFVLLLGPVLGLKALVIAATAIGWLALRGTGTLVWEAMSDRAPDREWISLLASAVVFGNYFLWHFNSGHITFIGFHLVFVGFYFSLKAALKGISLREAALVAFVTFADLSGGLYHSTVFLLIPLSISLLPFWIAARDQLRRAARFFAAVALGVAASFYKIAAVFAYQREFPRSFATVGSAYQEQMSLLHTAAMQLLPTWNDKFLGLARLNEPWSTSEYSAFSLLPWAFFALLVFGGIRAWRLKRHPLRVLLISLFVVCFSFSLPVRSSLSIHYWMNLALSDSIRDVGRYQILLTLWFFLILSTGISTLAARWQRMALYATLLVNFLSFGNLSLEKLKDALKVPGNFPTQMQALAITDDQDRMTTYMYPAIHAGYVVPNCYNPIRRQIQLMGIVHRSGTDLAAQRELLYRKLGRVPLIANDTDAECAESTYVTQNSLVIGKTCKPGVCLNLNAINLYEPVPERLYEDPVQQLWCIR